MSDSFEIKEGPDDGRSWSGEGGAQRLFESVRTACAQGGDLPARLEAGLRAALEMLAADPELAYLLTVDTNRGDADGALAALDEWIERFGGLLREAAASDPRTTTDLGFPTAFLIGGVRFQIALLVVKGEGFDLLRLLPGALEVLLAYYFEPGEPRYLARAALDAPG